MQDSCAAQLASDVQHTDAPLMRAASRVGWPRRGAWGESGLLVLIGGLVVLVMTQPAFGSFFFGEDFLYVRQFRQHGGDFWRAVLSPTDNIFFRPVFCAVNLFWFHVIPLDPWVHHVRNFLFIVLDILLLHRILVHLTTKRTARIIAVLFFAASKVHLVAIGYVNVYDSVISLLLLLLTVFFFLRYIDRRRWGEYALAMASCFLAIFTKDYGLVVGAVVTALVLFVAMTPREWSAQGGRWAWRLAPLPVMVLLYLGVRYTVVGLPPSVDVNATNVSSQISVYSPRLSLDVLQRKIVVLTSTMGNLSLDEPGAVGTRGVTAGLGAMVPALSQATGALEVALYLALSGLLVATVMDGRRAGWILLFPLVWIAAYFAPTLLTRNLQLYYLYEPLAGAAVLLGICLDRGSRRLAGAWVPALGIIVANGLISNYTSLYHWQFVANAAQRAHGAVVAAYGERALESLTFVTATRPFWEYTLGADHKGPLLPELLRQPELPVRFIDYGDLPARLAEANGANPIVDIDAGFVERKPLLLEALRPASTRAGVPFNVQPDGQAALAVDAQHAVLGTVIVWDGTPLPTSYGSERWLTALVPAELYSRPGRHEVYLQDRLLESNRLEFLVTP